MPRRPVVQTLMEKGIARRDALHVAAAIEGRADYFVTCDDRLLRRAKHVLPEHGYAIVVANLIDLVKEVLGRGRSPTERPGR